MSIVARSKNPITHTHTHTHTHNQTIKQTNRDQL
jgi:hypothetical protein